MASENKKRKLKNSGFYRSALKEKAMTMKRRLFFTPSMRKQSKRLTQKEKKIYDSIMSSFPGTNPESAYDKAIQGGVNFQFFPR